MCFVIRFDVNFPFQIDISWFSLLFTSFSLNTWTTQPTAGMIFTGGYGKRRAGNGQNSTNSQRHRQPSRHQEVRVSLLVWVSKRTTTNTYFYLFSAHPWSNSTNTHHWTQRHRHPLHLVVLVAVVQFTLHTTTIPVTFLTTVIRVMIRHITTIDPESRRRLTHNSYRRLGRKILPKDVVLLRFNGKSYPSF